MFDDVFDSNSNNTTGPRESIPSAAPRPRRQSAFSFGIDDAIQDSAVYQPGGADLGASQLDVQNLGPRVNVLGKGMGRVELEQLEGGEELYKLMAGEGPTGRRGFVESYFDLEVSQIPFVGDVIPVKNLLRIKDTFEKMEQGEDIDPQDRVYAALWLANQERKGNQTWKGLAGDIIKHLPSYMVEFGVYAGKGAAAGAAAPEPGPFSEAAGAIVGGGIGLAKVGGKISRKVANKMLGKTISKSYGKLLKSIGTSTYLKSLRQPVTSMLATGAKATIADVGVDAAFNIAQGENVFEQRGSVERQIHAQLQGDPMSANQARIMAITDDWIEYTSEAFGEVFAAAAKPVFDPIFEATGRAAGQTLGKYIDDVYGKLAGAQKKKGAALGMAIADAIDKSSWSVEKAFKMLKTGGYDGPFAEFAEERAGGFMRGLLGIEGEGPGLRNALQEVFISADQLKAEAVAFSVPVIGVSAIARARAYGYGGSKYSQALDTVLRGINNAGPENAYVEVVGGEIVNKAPVEGEAKRPSKRAPSTEELVEAYSQLNQMQERAQKPSGAFAKVADALLTVSENLMTMSFAHNSRASSIDLILAQHGHASAMGLGSAAYQAALAEQGVDNINEAKPEELENAENVRKQALTQYLQAFTGKLALQKDIIEQAKDALGSKATDEEILNYLNESDAVVRVKVGESYQYFSKENDPSETAKDLNNLAKDILARHGIVQGEVDESKVGGEAMERLSYEVSTEELEELMDNPTDPRAIQIMIGAGLPFMSPKGTGTTVGFKVLRESLKHALDHAKKVEGSELWADGAPGDATTNAAQIMPVGDGTYRIDGVAGNLNKLTDTIKQGKPLTSLSFEDAQKMLASAGFEKTDRPPVTVRILPYATSITSKDPVKLATNKYLSSYGEPITGATEEERRKNSEDFIRSTLKGHYDKEAGVWRVGLGGWNNMDTVYTTLLGAEYDTLEEFTEVQLRRDSWARTGDDAYSWGEDTAMFMVAASRAIETAPDEVISPEHKAQLLSLLDPRRQSIDAVVKAYNFLFRGFTEHVNELAPMAGSLPFQEAFREAWHTLMSLNETAGFLFETSKILGNTTINPDGRTRQVNVDKIIGEAYSNLTNAELEQLKDDLSAVINGRPIEDRMERPEPTAEPTGTEGEAPAATEEVAEERDIEALDIEARNIASIKPSEQAVATAENIRLQFSGQEDIEVTEEEYKLPDGSSRIRVTNRLSEQPRFQFLFRGDGGAAAEAGTETHAVIEKIVNDPLLESLTDEEKQQYYDVIEFIQGLKRDGYILLPEFKVWDETVAGTIDLLAIAPNGAVRIFDAKTMTSSPYEDAYSSGGFDITKAAKKVLHAAQLGAYAGILKKAGIQVVDASIVPLDRQTSGARPIITDPKTNANVLTLLGEPSAKTGVTPEFISSMLTVLEEANLPLFSETFAPSTGVAEETPVEPPPAEAVEEDDVPLNIFEVDPEGGTPAKIILEEETPAEDDSASTSSTELNNGEGKEGASIRDAMFSNPQFIALYSNYLSNLYHKEFTEVLKAAGVDKTDTQAVLDTMRAHAKRMLAEREPELSDDDINELFERYDEKEAAIAERRRKKEATSITGVAQDQLDQQGVEVGARPENMDGQTDEQLREERGESINGNDMDTVASSDLRVDAKINIPIMQLARWLVSPERSSSQAQQWLIESFSNPESPLKVFDNPDGTLEVPEDYVFKNKENFDAWASQQITEEDPDTQLLRTLARVLGYDRMFSLAQHVGDLRIMSNATLEYTRDTNGDLKEYVIGGQRRDSVSLRIASNNYASQVINHATNQTFKNLATRPDDFRRNMQLAAAALASEFSGRPGNRDVIREILGVDLDAAIARPAYFKKAMQGEPEQTRQLAQDITTSNSYYSALVEASFNFFKRLTGVSGYWTQLEKILRNDSSVKTHETLINLGRFNLSAFSKAILKSEMATDPAVAQAQIAPLSNAVNGLFYLRPVTAAEEEKGQATPTDDWLTISNMERLLSQLSRFTNAAQAKKPEGELYPGYVLRDWLTDSIDRVHPGGKYRDDTPVQIRISGINHRYYAENTAFVDDASGSPFDSELIDTRPVNDENLTSDMLMQIMHDMYMNVSSDPKAAKYVPYIINLGDKLGVRAINVPRSILTEGNFKQAFKEMHAYAAQMLIGKPWGLNKWIKRSRLLTSGGASPMRGIDGGLPDTIKVLVLEGETLDGYGMGSTQYAQQLEVSTGKPRLSQKAHFVGLDYKGEVVVIKANSDLAAEEHADGQYETHLQKYLDDETNDIQYITDVGAAKVVGDQTDADAQTFDIPGLGQVKGWVLEVPTRIIRETAHLEHPAVPEDRANPFPLFYDARNISNGDLIASTYNDYVQWVVDVLSKTGLPAEQDMMSHADSVARFFVDEGVDVDMPSVTDTVKVYRSAYLQRALRPAGYAFYAMLKPSGGKYNEETGEPDWIGGIEDKFLMDYEVDTELDKTRPLGVRVNTRSTKARIGYFVKDANVTREQLAEAIKKANDSGSAADVTALAALLEDSRGQDATGRLPLKDLIQEDGSVDLAAIIPAEESPDGQRLFLMGSWVRVDRTPGGGMHAHAMARITDPANWVWDAKTERWVSGKSNSVKLHPTAAWRAGVDYDGDMSYIPVLVLDNTYNFNDSAYPSIDTVEGKTMKTEQGREDVETILARGRAVFHNRLIQANQKMLSNTPLGKLKERINVERFDNMTVRDPADPNKNIKLGNVATRLNDMSTDDLGNVDTSEQMFRIVRGSSLGRDRIVAAHRSYEMLVRTGIVKMVKGFTLNARTDKKSIQLTAGEISPESQELIHSVFQDTLNIIIDDISKPRAVAMGIDSDVVALFATTLMHQNFKSEDDVMQFMENWAEYVATYPEFKAYRESLSAGTALYGQTRDLDRLLKKYKVPEARRKPFKLLVNMSRNMVSASKQVVAYRGMPGRQADYLSQTIGAGARDWVNYVYGEQYKDPGMPESKTAARVQDAIDQLVFATETEKKDPATDIITDLVAPEWIKHTEQEQVSYTNTVRLVEHSRHMALLDAVYALLPTDAIERIQSVYNVREAQLREIERRAKQGETEDSALRAAAAIGAEIETAPRTTPKAEESAAERLARQADEKFEGGERAQRVTSEMEKLREGTRRIISDAMEHVYRKGTMNPWFMYVLPATKRYSGKGISAKRVVARIKTSLFAESLNASMLHKIHEGFRSMAAEFEGGKFKVYGANRTEIMEFDASLLPAVYLLNVITEYNGTLSLRNGNYLSLFPPEILNQVNASLGKVLEESPHWINPSNQTEETAEVTLGRMIRLTKTGERDPAIPGSFVPGTERNTALVMDRKAEKVASEKMDTVRPLIKAGKYSELWSPKTSKPNWMLNSITTRGGSDFREPEKAKQQAVRSVKGIKSLSELPGFEKTGAEEGASVRASLALAAFLSAAPTADMRAAEVAGVEANDPVYNRELRDKIKGRLQYFEGVETTVYDDKGVPTIGAGYRLFPERKAEFEEVTGASFEEIVSGKASLTQAQVDRLMEHNAIKSIEKARSLVKPYDRIPTVGQALLADLAHWSILQQSPKALELLNAEDYTGFAKELMTDLKPSITSNDRMMKRIGYVAEYFDLMAKNGQLGPVTEAQIEEHGQTAEGASIEEALKPIDRDKPMNNALGGASPAVAGPSIVDSARSPLESINMLAWVAARNTLGGDEKNRPALMKRISQAHTRWARGKERVAAATNMDELVNALYWFNNTTARDPMFPFKESYMNTVVDVYRKIHPVEVEYYLKDRGILTTSELISDRLEGIQHPARVKTQQEVANPQMIQPKLVQQEMSFITTRPQAGPSIRSTAAAMYAQIQPQLAVGAPGLHASLVNMYNFTKSVESAIKDRTRYLNLEWGLYAGNGKLRGVTKEQQPVIVNDKPTGETKTEYKYGFIPTGQQLTSEELQLIKLMHTVSVDIVEYISEAAYAKDPAAAIKKAIGLARLRPRISAMDFDSLSRVVGPAIANKIMKVAGEILEKYGISDPMTILNSKNVDPDVLDPAAWAELKAAGIVQFVAKRKFKPTAEELARGEGFEVASPLFTVPASMIISEFDSPESEGQNAKGKLVDSGRPADRLNVDTIVSETKSMLKKVQIELSENMPALMSPFTPTLRFREAFMPHYYGKLGQVGTEEFSQMMLLERAIDEKVLKHEKIYDELARKSIKKGEPLPITSAKDSTLKKLFELKGIAFENRESALAKIKSGEYADRGLFAEMQVMDAYREITNELIDRVMQESMLRGEKADLNKAVGSIEDPLAEIKKLRNSMKQLTRKGVKGTGRFSAPRDLEKSTYEQAYLNAGLLPANITILDSVASYVAQVAGGARTRMTLNQMLLTTNPDGQPLVIADVVEDLSRKTTVDPAALKAHVRQLAQYFGVKLDRSKSDIDNLREIIRKHVEPLKDQYVKVDSPYPEVATFYAYTPGGAEENVLDMLSGGEVAALLKHVLRRPVSDPFGALDWLESVNGWMKTMSLGLSLFFPIAAIESLVAGTQGRVLGNLAGRNNLSFYEIRQMVKANHPYIQDLRRLAERAGVEFSDTADPFNIPIGELNKAAKTAYEAIYKRMGKDTADFAAPVLGLPAEQTRLIFESVFNTAKLYMFHHLITQERVAAETEGVEYNRVEASRRWGNFVNHALGGQNAAMYSWLTPSARRLLSLGLFSWNWSLSAWNIAGGGLITKPLLKNYLSPQEADFIMFKNWPAMFAIVLVAFPQLAQAGAYALGALLGGDDDEEERDTDKFFIWNNETGRRLHADITPIVRNSPLYKGAPSGKRRYYIRWGKQSYEVVRGWLDNPARTFASKLSSVARYAIEQATGETVGMGWDLGFKDMGLAGVLTDTDGDFMGSRVGHTIQSFTPFALRAWARSPDAAPFQLIGPVSKGTSFNRATEAYMGILESWAKADTYETIYKNKRVKANLKALGQHILDNAEANGYSPKKVLDSARAAVLRDLYADLYQAIEKQDKRRIERASSGIARVNGTIQSVRRSVENRNDLYGKPRKLTKEQKAAIVEAFRRP